MWWALERLVKDRDFTGSRSGNGRIICRGKKINPTTLSYPESESSPLHYTVAKVMALTYYYRASTRIPYLSVLCSQNSLNSSEVHSWRLSWESYRNKRLNFKSIVVRVVILGWRSITVSPPGVRVAQFFVLAHPIVCNCKTAPTFFGSWLDYLWTNDIWDLKSGHFHAFACNIKLS